MSNHVETSFINEIKKLILDAKEKVKTAINISMVYTYYEIGRRIVEQEQKGKNRAEYGKEVLKQLSIVLTKEFGKGFSERNLDNMCLFYKTYSNNKIMGLDNNIISVASFRKSRKKQISQTVSAKLDNNPISKNGHIFNLSWSIYVRLIRISNPEERRFYEIEAFTNNWSVRELNRQYDSSLYERLLLSKDKNKVKELSLKGQIIEKPMDAVKNPYVLEFLELKEDTNYSEKVLEKRIINKLQDFLLELGKGFTFVQRQMRLTFDDQHYYADLVFYNRLLRCFVVVDLKIGSVKHQDIGQMQMYVNYFDRYVKLPEENKTIGILLCKEKNESMVELTLPKDNDQIFASKYETVLPSKEELLKLVEEK